MAGDGFGPRRDPSSGRALAGVELREPPQATTAGRLWEAAVSSEAVSGEARRRNETRILLRMYASWEVTINRAHLDTAPKGSGASVLTSHSRVPSFEPLLIGIGVGIGIGIEPERPSIPIPIPIPIPTAKGWLDGVSPHRFWAQCRDAPRSANPTTPPLPKNGDPTKVNLHALPMVQRVDASHVALHGSTTPRTRKDANQRGHHEHQRDAGRWRHRVVRSLTVRPASPDFPMAHDFQSILLSKQTYRRQLAARPIGEKLRMLDALRERELAIRGRASLSGPLMPVPEAQNREISRAGSSAKKG
jgi:hypothetical protein